MGERSIPLDKGLGDCLLAWEMNGEPVPLVHGGPLRLIVPGYYGVNNIKYVGRLAFAPAESDARIQHSGYRLRPVGEQGGPGQPSMWTMSLMSWITRPLGGSTVAAGRVQVFGVAFAGERTIAGVEVSIDGGASWREARVFGPDLGPSSWRQFALPIDGLGGRMVPASRARSADGDLQPEQRLENHRGYGNSSWRDMAVEVEFT